MSAGHNSGSGANNRVGFNSGAGQSANSRGGFNHGAGQEQCRPFHGRGHMYGGYARGWQRHHPRGYRYSGTRFDLNQGRAGSSRSVAQPNQATLSQAPPRGSVNQVNAIQVETGAPAQGQGGPTQHEAPHVSGVFKAQKTWES
jgi:hypothetical protein